jgi:4-amino-4-deoxy-L-arabinose transferase-like glycosyltransferase
VIDGASDAGPIPHARAEQRRASPIGMLRRRWATARFGGLAVAVTASAVLNTVQLAQNGYANIFYSAAVRSMLGSWHNFFFVSFDPGGLVSVDKPPLGLWVQALSAKVFGFSALSLLLPEALMGVGAVALLYVLLARRFGTLAALTGSLAFATLPSFVAVSRANGVDTLLILLSLLACAAALRACETGRWRWLMLSALFVGLAFNTKTLAAYLVVPGIACGYLLCAPGSLRVRIAHLLAGGVVMAVVSFAWIAAVEATPASKRPYVGSSTNNTEIGLTFEYNGVGRVQGQNGGPGQTRGRPGGRVPNSVQQRVNAQRQREHALPAPPRPVFPPSRREARNRLPVPFGGPPGPFRLFGVGLGDQAAWILPFALVGLLAALALLWDERGRVLPGRGGARAHSPGPSHTPVTAGPAEQPAAAAPGHWRHDPRLAATLVLGGWLVTEALVLSASKGIVHPYYVAALGPGVGAMTGVGVYALARLCERGPRAVGLVLAGAAVLASVATEVVLMHRQHYMQGFEPVLVVGAIAALAALALSSAMHRRLATSAAIAAALGLLLIVPTRYAASTWLAPVQPTFPAAGPKQTAGHGGFGLTARSAAVDQALLTYLHAHGATKRFELFTVAADTAAPFILMGHTAAGIAGYSGVDPVVGGPGLAGLVARGEARYVLLGGEYSSRGGNRATQAVIAACRELSPVEWRSPVDYPSGLVLFDCAGHERALAAQP